MLTSSLLAWTVLTGGCTRSGGWVCTIGASSASPGGHGRSSAADAAPPEGIDVEPMCRATGGADHCMTLPEKPAKVPTADVAAMAWDSFELPPPRPHTSPSGRSWVSLPTYLWIDASAWKPRLARASVDGQTVTMTGTPLRVDWSTGEAATTCDGPGTPYHRGGPPSTCAYTYRRATSATVTATVYYTVNWTCSGACDALSGSYGTFPASASTHLTVQEIQTRTDTPS
ncbi:hypothetical protein [Actinomadura gamaensis]|uniref:Uncharacterized protein n=1 Tax=Actinomadura gamaensis TaxID=1763541 RepID=A0ABV9TSA7_9ACTN